MALYPNQFFCEKKNRKYSDTGHGLLSGVIGIYFTIQMLKDWPKNYFHKEFANQSIKEAFPL